MKRIVASTGLVGVIAVLIAYVPIAVWSGADKLWQVAAWSFGAVCLVMTAVFLWQRLRFDVRYPDRDMYRRTYGRGWRQVYDNRLEGETRRRAFGRYMDDQFERTFGIRRR